MNAMPQPVERPVSARPLTPAEIDQVSGGVVPILIGMAVGAIVAAAVDAVSDALEEDESSEDQSAN